mgnify:CR=1 FL=1
MLEVNFNFYILALAMGLCISMIAFLRLPSLKVSILLLLGLLVYDVFWVRNLPQLHLKHLNEEGSALLYQQIFILGVFLGVHF